MNMVKNTWIDKNQLMIMIFVTVIMFAFFLLLINDIPKHHPENSAVELIFALLLCAWPVFLFLYWPIRIVNGTIVLARCGFLRFGRRAIPVDEITEIKITDVKKWDEGGSANIYSVVRVIDNRGEKYRNIIFNGSIAGFKAELAKRNRSYIAFIKDERQFELEKEHKPDEGECLSCGEKFLIKEDKCPKCGWSWKTQKS